MRKGFLDAYSHNFPIFRSFGSSSGDRGKMSAINLLYLLTGCLDLALIAGQKKQRLPHAGRTCLEITPETTLMLNLCSIFHSSNDKFSFKCQIQPPPNHQTTFFPPLHRRKTEGRKVPEASNIRKESTALFYSNRYSLKYGSSLEMKSRKEEQKAGSP